MIIGNRIPRSYFLTSGKGESEVTVHAGSFHFALHDAKIESYNLMTYSSILPGIAKEVAAPKTYQHGAVAESIMAVATPQKGELHSAGLVFGWLFNKETGEKYGGVVCEFAGPSTEEEARETLEKAIKEIYENSYQDKYILKDLNFKIESLRPQKKYGTVLVAMCFVDYIYPIIKENEK